MSDLIETQDDRTFLKLRIAKSENKQLRFLVGQLKSENDELSFNLKQIQTELKSANSYIQRVIESEDKGLKGVNMKIEIKRLKEKIKKIEDEKSILIGKYSKYENIQRFDK